MEGWISLHRKLLEKPIWKKSNAKQKVILITLLLMANHEEEEWEWQGNKFKVKPGQFVTSLENIAKLAGSDISIKCIRVAIAKFKKYEFMAEETTKTGRLITIINWESYQIDKNLGQSEGQRQGKDGATNNNDNKYNNIPFDKIKNSFNEICSDLPKIKDITSKRKVKVATRWKEQPDFNYWIEIFKKVHDSDFLNGKNDRNWKCSFDWIFENDTNYIKIDEGKYKNKNGNNKEIKGNDLASQYNLPG